MSLSSCEPPPKHVEHRRGIMDLVLVDLVRGHSPNVRYRSEICALQ